MHNSIKYSLLSFLFVLLWGTASAQFSIKPETEEVAIEPLELIDTGLPAAIEKNFFDRAAYEARRRELRKERNTIEFNASLETSLQQFENWTGSGTNNFYALSNIFFRHQYKKDKFSSDYRIDINFGMNYIDSKAFKNKDEFKVNAQMGWRAHENWSYSASANFRSQFAPGRESRDDETIVSRFMAPGYFDVAVGFTYQKKDFPLKATLSPVGGNMIFVLDNEIANMEHKYGTKEGERMLSKVGPSVDLFFDLSFGKRKSYRYRSNLYAFSAYRDMLNPTFRWENTFDVRITRYLSIKLYGQMYYLKEASKSLQYQYSFMIGVKYVFKNK